MVKEYNFSYTGILKSLIYFFEIKGNSIEKSNGGIGIVPFIYTEAYKYYLDMHEAQERNRGKDASSFVGSAREVVIVSPEKQARKLKLFNMEEE